MDELNHPQVENQWRRAALRLEMQIGHSINL